MPKRPQILFLVHVEEMFRSHFPDSLYVHRLVRACRARKYDRVVCLVSGIDNYEPIPELVAEGVEVWDWSWGYEPEVFESQPEELPWVIEAPQSAHEYTWIPPEVRDAEVLRQAKVFVGGGYDGECLADWEAVLEHQEIPYTRVKGYIYG